MQQQDRFEVVLLGVTEIYYGIRDNRRHEYNLPEFATTIFFESRACAEIVSASLNIEWVHFLHRTDIAKA